MGQLKNMNGWHTDSSGTRTYYHENEVIAEVIEMKSEGQPAFYTWRVGPNNSLGVPERRGIEQEFDDRRDAQRECNLHIEDANARRRR